MSDDTAAEVLSRGLYQLETLLGSISQGDLGRPTPCSDWSVSDLVDHVVKAPAKFARMVRGEHVDWSAPTPHENDFVAAYRRHADELRAALAANPDVQPGPDWQCAEIAVHTWDLAIALGRSLGPLDSEVAQCGLTFMRASLTEDNRSPAFLPEVPTPPDSDPYTRIAAFAGRAV